VPDSVTRTLVASDTPSAAKPDEPKVPTALLPVTTTLSKAASAVSGERTVETRSHRWPWSLAVGLAVAGSVTVLLWRRAETPPRPAQATPVARVVAASPPDAGSPVLAPPDAAPQEMVPPLVPALRKARAHSPGKKSTKIRMEDL
jgi:hypothetical protein